MRLFRACIHPGKFHLGVDGLSIVKPHARAVSCFAREQGYVIARIEPAYAHLAILILKSLNELPIQTA